MNKTTTERVTISATEALRRSRNAMHIRHRLNAGGTGAHRNRKRYCRKAKHRVDHGSE